MIMVGWRVDIKFKLIILSACDDDESYIVKLCKFTLLIFISSSDDIEVANLETWANTAVKVCQYYGRSFSRGSEGESN